MGPVLGEYEHEDIFHYSLSPSKEGNFIGETRAGFCWKDISLYIEENIFCSMHLEIMLYIFNELSLTLVTQKSD